MHSAALWTVIGLLIYTYAVKTKVQLYMTFIILYICKAI